MKIAEVNGGPFILGLDRSAVLERERRALYAALAQVDLGRRQHSHQTDAALGRMAGQILQTALARCPSLPVPGDELIQFVRDGGDVEAVAWDVGVIQRPPMSSVPEYRVLRGIRSGRPE